MINEIGQTAGKIWHILDEAGPLTVTKIKAQIKGDNFLTIAALGWLARENKIEMELSGKSIKVTLI